MGLLDDPAQLQALLQQFAPSDEDKKQALKQSMLALGFGLLGGRKGDEGRAIAGAGLNALDMYNNQLQQANQRRLGGMTAASGYMSLKEKARAMDDADQARAAAIQFYGGQTPGQPAAPAAPAAPVQFGMNDRGLGDTPAAPAGAAPPSAAAPAAPQGGGMTKLSKFEQYSQLSQFYASKGLIGPAQQAADMAEKYRPKLKEQQTLTDPQSGQRIRVNVYDDGSIEKLPLAPDKEKLTFQSVGGKTFGIEPMSGDVNAVYENSVSPDSQLSANVTMRGQNMTDARSREQNAMSREQGQWETNLDRGIQINKVTGATRPITESGAPIGNALDQKRKQAGQTVNDILDVAEPLVRKSTGSYIGAGIDAAAAATGMPTKGGEATAQLKALEGQLMLAQPRMEGPQSDKDTALYKQMAGQIGDPTVPRQYKLAAMQTIRQIYNRYADKQPKAGATGGWSVVEIK